MMLNMVFGSLANPVNAEKTTTQTSNSDYGLPSHRRDGGSRSSKGNCLADADSRNLTALIPEKTVGVNVSATPKLFFYVPKVSKEKTLEFVLRNQQDELIYEAFLTTEGKGIMSVDLPANVQKDIIEQDNKYHWYLSMICNSEERSRDIVVEGWMRQSTVDVATQQKLDRTNPAQQAELYRDRGFWYDALSVLADNQQSAEELPIIRAKWTELLESVGLKEVANAPFIESQLIESSIKK
ncbi:DUF928 domain-containing protein [Waterburya agarophytonicola K14]|uniref:DUF928 domain-containing protein n=2 Tax=Waterburya TaxID=2886915 RepID=A0A964BRA9_9CYAN|nr:DUF928 domain-containing protein [Waterburya agarophytonicola KI4]